ncbi:LCP family protein [Micromonospora sp. NPDC049679]|uniref:LCP family protein n=1 Tax=Micromonospora sp. NPDC049679 TaxID=3155920 RepID=UPI0033D5DA98
MPSPSRRRPPTPTAQRRRGPRWPRVLVALGAALIMISGTAIVGSKVLIDRYTGGVAQDNLLAGAAKAATPGKPLTGPVNMLLLGVDERARNPGDVRSDTIMILHVPASHDQAYLVSVPRDTWVDAPPFPRSGFTGGAAKLTDVFHAGAQGGGGRAGGAQLVALTIKQITGIEFNGAAIIDFNGFKNVVDALGGVDLCVDYRVKSQHMRMVNGKPMWLADARQYGGGEEIWHEKGCRHMPGWSALDYSRQRYGLPNGDYDRQRHQQQLVKAIGKEAMSAGVISNPAKLDRVITAAGNAFILDTGGVPMADFIFTLKGMAANDVLLVKTNGGTFNPVATASSEVEGLSAESLEMFTALKQGHLDQYVIERPELVSRDG